MTQPSKSAGTHVHLGFNAWENQSRAWRAGTTAIEQGYASDVLYVGHKKIGLEDREDISPNQSIMRIGATPAVSGSRRWRRASSLPRWWRACQTQIPMAGVNLVTAHSLAALPAAVWLSQKHDIPLLYDAHELETRRNGWSWPIQRVAGVVEAQMIRHCDHTIVVNNSIRDWYRAAYNGISISTVRNVPVHCEVKKSLASSLRLDLGIDDQALVFVYCGLFAKGRGLSELVAAFKGLDDRRHLVLIGGGPAQDALAEQSANVPNVHLHPFVPQSELISLLKGADVGVSVVATDSLSYYYALPNKLFEYAAAGLAICVGQGIEMQRFAAEYPLAKSAHMTTKSLRDVLIQFTREEIEGAKPAMKAFKPPSWQSEYTRLIAAYERTMAQGAKRKNR